LFVFSEGISSPSWPQLSQTIWNTRALQTGN